MMKSILLFVLLVKIVSCDHFIMGDTNYKTSIYHQVVQYHAIPFTKREKDLFYSSLNQSIIKSIIGYDNLHSKASARVTAGGVGFSYVNIKMISERGKGLDYDIGIY